MIIIWNITSKRNGDLWVFENEFVMLFLKVIMQPKNY